jgi:predicted peptidase
VLAAPAMQQKHACVVMAPACAEKGAAWVQSDFRKVDARPVMPELMEALNAVIAEVKADPARIYLTGQSLGGVGTWGILANHADKFAAAAPVCGIWKVEDAPKMNGVAIWAFHGADDPTVPVAGSRDMIEALKKAGTKPEPKYTEFPGVGHGSWGPAYETAELWEWMFAQRKAKS